jgi:hypothetical protein
MNIGEVTMRTIVIALVKDFARWVANVLDQVKSMQHRDRCATYPTPTGRLEPNQNLPISWDQILCSRGAEITRMESRHIFAEAACRGMHGLLFVAAMPDSLEWARSARRFNIEIVAHSSFPRHAIRLVHTMQRD